jgi:hypothetical protein
LFSIVLPTRRILIVVKLRDSLALPDFTKENPGCPFVSQFQISKIILHSMKSKK